jgi:subtilase family serine protease
MRLLNGTLALGAAVLAATVAPSAVAAPSPAGASHRAVHVCGAAPVGTARCNADVVVDAAGKPAVTTAPNGYGPADLWAAYGLSPAKPADIPNFSFAGRPIIAIVDAYDAPTAEQDLGVYRAQYGLGACTTANGCFTKTGQAAGRLPRANAGWAQEISLDVDMASAICPTCRILLVEAKSASFSDLGTAENRAAALGAAVISNSFGGNEFSGEVSADSQYFKPRSIPVTVSSGDSGYGVEYPASSANVIAVGGTTLTNNGGTWSETAWSGAGSGCSAYVAKPSWQTATTNCAKRAVADVSAIADPATGVAVYDSTSYQGSAGWMKFGGTSVAAPVVAAIYALAGPTANPGATLYGAAGSNALHDVTSGTNGTCSILVLCHATTGWDGPTGVGTPNSLSAF